MNVSQILALKERAKFLVTDVTDKLYPLEELVYLTNDDFIAIRDSGVLEPGFIYFGTLIIQSFDESGCVIDFQNINNKDGMRQTLYVFPASGLYPQGSVNENVLFDYIQEYSGCNCHFYGWKFTRGLGWVEQSPTVTPGAGWSLADGVYTHTSGKTEQIYLGPWTVSSKIRVTVTFTGITAGSLDLQMDVSGVFGTISADGTYSFEVETDSSDGALFFVPTNDFDGSYDTTTLKIEKYTYV